MILMKTGYWYNSIDELFNAKSCLQFWPEKHQTKEQKFNAITRFILYAGMVMSLYKDSSYYFVMSVFLVVIMSFFSKKTEGFRSPRHGSTAPRHTNPKHMRLVDEECQKPTDDNPFANVLMNEYAENVHRHPACPIEDVADDVHKKFMKGLYSDITDIYEKENSQRQFYSTPNTQIPNDQINFAKWCYMKDTTCKTDPSQCTGFEAGN